MKRIGILGGSSQEATALYYRRINQQVNDTLGAWNSAELIISSMNFQRSVDAIELGQWDRIGDYLAERALAVERAGADLLICVSNTLHKVADRFTAQLRIPFLHIVDPTARVIRAAGLSKVGLLGTKPVMAMDYLKRRYRDFGVEALVPRPTEQHIVDRILFDELCRGHVNPESKAIFLKAADELKAAGAEGLILGCTEIPFLINQADRPGFPMFDTVELHVAAAVELALSHVKTPMRSTNNSPFAALNNSPG